MFQITRRLALPCVLTALVLAGCGPSVDPVKRGEYLAAIAACGDCHTPGAMLGTPEMDKKFGGGSVGFQMPDGTFFPPNLTPDKETGLGNWTEEQIVTAFRTGARPDGRILSEVMPYKHWYSQFTDDDALAIAKYLKSLPPNSNKVPGPFGPSETPTGPYMATVMPGAPTPAAPGAQPLSAPVAEPTPSAPGTPTAPPTEGTPTTPAQSSTPPQ